MTGFVVEFAYSFLATLRLAVKAWRRRRFDVIQACNPPDTFWLLALFFRPLGVKFVYDQHDLCPELYESRFPNGSKAVKAGSCSRWSGRRAEQRTTSSSPTVRTRRRRWSGRRGRGRVTIVRTGPDPDLLSRGPDIEYHRRGFKHLAVYIGVMGPRTAWTSSSRPPPT